MEGPAHVSVARPFLSFFRKVADMYLYRYGESSWGNGELSGYIEHGAIMR